MPKTTKEILSDAIEKGIVNNIKRNGDSVYYEIMSTPCYRTDLLWYSQEEVDKIHKFNLDYLENLEIKHKKDINRLRKELKDKIIDIIKLSAYQDEDKTWFGVDTNLGKIEEIANKIFDSVFSKFIKGDKDE